MKDFRGKYYERRKVRIRRWEADLEAKDSRCVGAFFITIVVSIP